MQPYQQRMRSPGMQCGSPQFNMNGPPPQTPPFNPQRPPPQVQYYNQQWPPALPETFGVPMNNTQWQPRGPGGQHYNNNNNNHIQPGGPNNNNNIPPGGPNNHHIQPGGPNNNNHIQPGGQNYNNNNFFGSGGPNHNNINNNHISQIRPPPNFPPNNQCGPMFNPRGQNRSMGRPQFNNHGNQGQHRGQTPGGGPPRFFRSPGQGQNRPRFHGNQGNQQHQPNKKVKVDKRELPENNRFYCDICDRGYKDEDKYQAHIDSHERCPKEGCSYVAAGKLVQLHIKLQHNSGMAKKIWSLASQEDIAKWREERKKNFPTAANIEKKKAELADRIARGEVIEEKYFGKMRGRNNSRGRGRGGGRGRGRGRGRWQDNIEGNSSMEDGKGDNCDTQTGVKGDNADRKRKMEGGNDEEGGEKKLKEGESENLTIQEKMDSLAKFFVSPDSDSESSSDSSSDSSSAGDGAQTGSSSKQELVAAGALGSLITTYSISSESEPEEVTSKDATKQTVASPKTNATNDDKEEDKTSPPGKPGQPKGRQQQRQRNRGPRKNNNNHFPSKVDKSLLEKLLAKEIRQERNKIMQCVHYIVKHNFFEENKTS